ncbi:uncharacterized protein DUF4112 [Brevirhabdus pacifica]|nr:DUF4112 domain-containing protein [Brevirhabdus pacifica]PJJ87361.1 uncharacterized protein DUF4112 [Brevirhabdus pacifica]
MPSTSSPANDPRATGAAYYDPATHSPHHAKLERLEKLAGTMDSFMRIPGTGIRLGLDSLLGLIPGVGDAAALGPAGYIVYSAHQMGAPKSALAKMTVNIGIDALIGSIPLIGDIFDVGWKANRRNVALLRKHLEEAERKEGRVIDATPVGRV